MHTVAAGHELFSKVFLEVARACFRSTPLVDPIIYVTPSLIL
jgi:hypothetical protein